MGHPEYHRINCETMMAKMQKTAKRRAATVRSMAAVVDRNAEAAAQHERSMTAAAERNAEAAAQHARSMAAAVDRHAEVAAQHMQTITAHAQELNNVDDYARSIYQEYMKNMDQNLSMQDFMPR